MKGGNNTYSVLLDGELFSFGPYEVVYEIVHDLDAFLEGGFGADVEKSFESPERIDVAPVDQSIGIIEGFDECISFLVWALQAIQFHSEPNFEYGIQSAFH